MALRLLAAPFASEAQQAGKVPHVGLATELVKLNVAVIVASSSDVTRAAQEVTKTIPIVMALSGDPAEAGFVASLARPGGNVTGFSTLVEGFTRNGCT
jgi:ABC-type uncharacterized transport system substrate-binding protein